MSYQGIDILIEAAPAILTKRPGARFVIIGEGPMKACWQQKASEKGLGKHFKFTGQIAYEKAPTYLGAMDVCVAPFKNNAGLRSPVKIFDYMACGRPVVASRIQGTTDIFKNSGTLTLVKPEDPESLADAIVDLLVDIQKAEKIAQKGRTLILQKYDRRIFAARITDEAEKLLATKRIY
jgi:glycosyltransferase involved in cell wall biosynthesis